MISFSYLLGGSIQSIDFEELGYEMQTEEVLHFLSSHLQEMQGKKLRKRKTKLIFRSKHSLVNFSYVISLQIEKSHHIKISYQLKINDLHKITLALIIFIAFFSRLNVSTFFTFSFSICTIFYILNLWFIHSAVRRWIRKIPIFSAEEKLKVSILHNQCPACHSTFGIYDLSCKNCGLNLESYRPILPFNITKYENKSICYHYKK